MKLYEIISLLAATSSTKEKQKILEDNKNNELLRRYFEATLNPFYNYFIRLKAIPSKSGSEELTVDAINLIVDTLTTREKTGHAARDFLNDVMESLTLDDQVLLKNMINHDPNCKVAEGIVNKVWKKMIPEFPCMLAEQYNDKTHGNIREGAGQIVVQKKEDGGRVAIVVDNNGAVTLYSRNGNILETHDMFTAMFQQYRGQVFDGELLVLDDRGIQDRKTGNGIFNKAVRGTISVEEAAKLHIVLWDMIPHDKWLAGYDATAYADRLKNLVVVVDTLPTHKASLIKSKIVDTMDQAMQFYYEMLELGFEGAMVKNIDMPWENKRCNYLLKLKSTKTTTLLCVAVQPHKKNPNLIGSLECVTSDKLLRTSVGSGLKELDRMKDPEFFIGQLIDVKYNMLISSKSTDEYALFLPRYNDIRLDQSEADTLEHIKGQE